MRDITPLRFTQPAMRDVGDIRARPIGNGQHHHAWFAGPKPLNAPAIQDRIADGWPGRDADNQDVRIEAWPSFATAIGGRTRADDFARCSRVRHVGSAETIARVHDIRRVFAAYLYRDGGGYPAFEVQVEHKNGAGALCLHSNDAGEPGSPPVRFAPRRGTRLASRLGRFTWSHSVSKPRLDWFGGGAHVTDLGNRATADALGCAGWLSGHLDWPVPGTATQTEAPP